MGFQWDFSGIQWDLRVIEDDLVPDGPLQLFLYEYDSSIPPSNPNVEQVIVDSEVGANNLVTSLTTVVFWGQNYCLHEGWKSTCN